MTLYAMIMFLVTALLATISVAIYRGNTQLLHDYHQTYVSDKAAYGKAIGKALLLFSCALFASGVIALIGKNMIPAVIVLFVGCGVGIGFLCAVQIKYNRKK